MIQQYKFPKRYCPFCNDGVYKTNTTFEKIEICEKCFNATLLKEKWQKEGEKYG